MPVSEITDQAHKQAIEAVEQVHEFVVDAVKRWTESVPSLRYADQLPNAAELVDGAFDLAEKAIEINREFVGRVLDTVVPAKQPASA